MNRPVGGHFTIITAASLSGQLSLNNRGDVAFGAATDTGDEAMFLYSSRAGTLSRIGGIGTVIPGTGTIVSLEQVGSLIFPPPPVLGFPISNAALNGRGQVAFAATVTDGITVHGVLLVATPQFAQDQ